MTPACPPAVSGGDYAPLRNEGDSDADSGAGRTKKQLAAGPASASLQADVGHSSDVPSAPAQLFMRLGGSGGSSTGALPLLDGVLRNPPHSNSSSSSSSYAASASAMAAALLTAVPRSFSGGSAAAPLFDYQGGARACAVVGRVARRAIARG